MKIVAALGVFIAFCSAANASQVTLTRDPRFPTVASINIDGIINSGDEETVHTLSLNEGKAVFELNSSGGNVTAALAIGAWIRLRGFSSSVGPGRLCASACALIWLAGNHRYLSPSSKIGFHAAYLSVGSKTSESGVANAVIGAYLTYLNLSVPLVRYVTEAPPSGMKWLTAEDAKRLGLVVNLIGE